MKKLALLFAILIGLSAFAQIDPDQLSLDISKAEAANLEQLMEFMWKRYSVVTVDGEVKLETTTDMSFDEEGKIQYDVVKADSDVKQKRGIRGKIQANTMENNMEYVGHALELALAYSYMSKDQLLDFFGKAEITEQDGVIQATAGNVYVEGDKLTVWVESETKLFQKKEFSSFLGEDRDPINGEINYEKFSNGVSHSTGSVMNLAAKNAVIDAKNKDYSQRIH